MHFYESSFLCVFVFFLFCVLVLFFLRFFLLAFQIFICLCSQKFASSFFSKHEHDVNLAVASTLSDEVT